MKKYFVNVKIKLRWSRLGRYLFPLTYPTVGVWLGGVSGTFDPEERQKRIAEFKAKHKRKV